jgi:hypothetical protein
MVVKRGRPELMATGVVDEGTADEHGVQKLAATANFGQRRIVLQGVWIHDRGAIEYLARSEDAVRPTHKMKLTNSGVLLRWSNAPYVWHP